MTNHDTANLLRNIAAAYTIKNENKFRFQIIAYQKAADAIEGSNQEVEELYKEDKLDSIPGIGKSIEAHLKELFKTGKVKHFDEATEGIPRSLFPLLSIPTFGPKRAFKLVKEFKLNNPETVLDDLEKLAERGKIAQIPGFGEKSQKDIIRVLSEYKEGRKKKARMVLPYASLFSDKVIEYLKKSEFVDQAYPLGSLRRMAATVGDIDIAAATDKPKEVIDHFVSYPNIERILEKGSTTASILISGGKQVDLMTQPLESFGSLLQHFTGSKDHNIRLREYALKKGLSLSEYGIKHLTKNKEPKTQKFETEEEFYQALGMDWIPPEIRENTGEIGLAVQHKLPKLIELKDIKGDLHIHSDYPLEPSHDLGRNSMQEIIDKAIKLKYDYIAFSEHNPSTSKHTKQQIYSILSRRKEFIEQIKSSNKYIRVINLLEVDILPNGSLAVDDRSLSLMDAVIVSIHSSFSLTRKDMTKRILKGLTHPKAKILGHPTGRILNRRTGYELNWKELFEFCKKNNKALEINAWPTRLDLPDTYVRKAIEQEVKLIINTDSHASYQMDMMKYGVAVGRRGWATKNDILNTMEYNNLIKWLKT